MRISLRIKLTLIALLLPLIPLFGLRFGDMIQKDLLESRRETMLFSARAIAAVLSGQSELLDRAQFLSLNPTSDVYMYPLRIPIRINGNDEDWQKQPVKTKMVESGNIIQPQGKEPEQNFYFSQRLGFWKKHLYAFFEIHDRQLVYQKKNSPYLNRSDHLKITIEDHDRQLRSYIIAASEPGWVNGFLMPLDPDDPFSEKLEPRIQGMWLETDYGYNIELRIPMSLIGRRLGFSVANVTDQESGRIEDVLGSTGEQDIGRAIIPSSEIERILMRLDRPDSRVLVVDQHHKVRASYGKLADQFGSEKEETTILSKISIQVLPLT